MHDLSELLLVFLAEAAKPCYDERMITLTKPAAKRIQMLKDIEKKPVLNLRIYITGGGCSGFQYGFAFEDNVKPDDTLIECDLLLDQQEKELSGAAPGAAHSVGVVIDPLSYPYLMGAEVDFVEGLYGAHFKVNNPNAKSTCGCGASFSL
jgi:iron-sulfur cluster insertion protein